MAGGRSAVKFFVLTIVQGCRAAAGSTACCAQLGVLLAAWIDDVGFGCGRCCFSDNPFIAFVRFGCFGLGFRDLRSEAGVADRFFRLASYPVDGMIW
jgi:hypothetical protein